MERSVWRSLVHRMPAEKGPQEAKAEAILGRFDEALKTARAKAAGKRRPRIS